MNDVVVAVEDTITDLSPDGWQTLADCQIGRHIFPGIVDRGPDLGFRPSAAEAWSATSEGRSWTFTVPSGRTFHDGSPLDVDAVAWNISRRLVPALGLSRWVVSVEVRKDTVMVHTDRPVASLIDRLALPRAALVAPAAWEAGVAVGWGHRIVDVRPDAISIGARPGAGRGPSTVTFRPFHDGLAMWHALQSGVVDIAYECPYDIIKRAGATGVVDGIRIASAASLSVNMLMFNLTRSPSDQVLFRRKAASAMDARKLLDKAHLGVGGVPGGPISPISLFASANDRYRPVAGEGPGHRHEVDLIGHRSYNQWTIQLICEQLASVGIDCRPELLGMRVLLERIREGAFHLALTGAAVSVDPDVFLSEFFHSDGRSNYSGVRDRLLDSALDDGRTQVESAKRLSAYRRAAQRLGELIPAVYLRHGASVIAHRARVAGIVPHPDHLLRLTGVTITDENTNARTPPAVQAKGSGYHE